MQNDTLELEVLEGEFWWGGLANDGSLMPFGEQEYAADMGVSLGGNQGMPLLISSAGRYVWSDQPFRISFKSGLLRVQTSMGSGSFETGEGLADLRGVFRYVAQKYFPLSGRFPDPLLFTHPQYNTWIEMKYELDQTKVIEYANAILAHNFPPGVMIVDDNWQEDHGVWKFHPGRFPQPKAMVKTLHDMGFKVMLWVSPFISPDSPVFRELLARGYCLKDSQGKPAIRSWWNGHSAILDDTNPAALNWFSSCLDTLVEEFGIDGFKFDAGDLEYYCPSDQSFLPATPAQHCENWSRLGLRYNLNEFRASWKMADQPLGQRQRDKHHCWGRNGLADLIPNGLAQGLMGYSFICPDMVGGGDILSFTDDNFAFDPELFVRYTQCSALFPMLQFSTAPWKVLEEPYLDLVIEAARLHTQLGSQIEALLKHSASTGEPILRHLAYNFPGQGYEMISDQFMLGETILVAPVLQKGAVRRKIIFPPGLWYGDDETEVRGPAILEVKAPLSRLPWYRHR